MTPETPLPSLRRLSWTGCHPTGGSWAPGDQKSTPAGSCAAAGPGERVGEGARARAPWGASRRRPAAAPLAPRGPGVPDHYV